MSVSSSLSLIASSHSEPIRGTVVLSGNIDSRYKEPTIKIYAFSEESIKECRSLHGRCSNKGLQRSWHDRFSKIPGGNFPQVLPLRIFKDKDGACKGNGDEVQLIFKKQLVILTCAAQQCSYTESLNSDKFSYSYLEGLQESITEKGKYGYIGSKQTEWDRKNITDFSVRLERKIEKMNALSSEIWKKGRELRLANADKVFDYDAWVAEGEDKELLRLDQQKEKIKTLQSEISDCESEIQRIERDRASRQEVEKTANYS